MSLQTGGGQHVDIDKLTKSAPENIEFFVVRRPLTYKEIYIDLLESHCSLCICKPVNFGVGYTQVLDSMACGIPCILTWNKDNPIDLDKEGVGRTVPVRDVEALALAMKKMVDDKEETLKMSRRSRALVENHFNIEYTARRVVKFIEDEVNKR